MVAAEKTTACDGFASEFLREPGFRTESSSRRFERGEDALGGVVFFVEIGVLSADLLISGVLSERPELLRFSLLGELTPGVLDAWVAGPGDVGGVDRGEINLDSISIDLRSQKLWDRRYGSPPLLAESMSLSDMVM
jgi:hypothetical protein